jgi:hypothetical protein
MANTALATPATKSEAVRDGVMRIAVSFLVVAQEIVMDGAERRRGLARTLRLSRFAVDGFVPEPEASHCDETAWDRSLPGGGHLVADDVERDRGAVSKRKEGSLSTVRDATANH